MRAAAPAVGAVLRGRVVRLPGDRQNGTPRAAAGFHEPGAVRGVHRPFPEVGEGAGAGAAGTAGALSRSRFVAEPDPRRTSAPALDGTGQIGRASCRERV